MKSYFFHLMPYAALDLDYTSKHESAWVTLPNSYYESNVGKKLYDRFIGELELADRLGFDGICVNEHHQTAYGLMPAPNLIAAALARTTRNAKICILGRALPLVSNPIAIAEEFAMLDQLSGGRIVAGLDVGLSGGTLGVMGAYAKGAPVRIIGASSTGSTELYWFVPANSPLQHIREANNKSIAFSTTGASTHAAVLHFVRTYGLTGAKSVATGNPAATMTQTISGQVDVGWAVAPFGLDEVAKGTIRIVARPSDLPELKGQTIRVQITNLKTFTERKDTLERYMDAYRETLDWMYTSPEAIQRYVAFSGFSESAVRRAVPEFLPKESLQTGKIIGLDESMNDAILFKFLSEPLTERQLAELIQVQPPKER